MPLQTTTIGAYPKPACTPGRNRLQGALSGLFPCVHVRTQLSRYRQSP